VISNPLQNALKNGLLPVTVDAETHQQLFSLLAEGPVGAGSYLFSARKSFLDLIIKKTGLTAVPQYYNFQGKIAYNLSPGQKLIINGMFGDDRIHIHDSDESGGVDRGAENVKSKNRQYTAGAELRTVWNSNLASFLTVSTVSNRYGAYVYRTKSGAEYFHNYSDEKEHTLKIIKKPKLFKAQFLQLVLITPVKLKLSHIN